MATLVETAPLRPTVITLIVLAALFIILSLALSLARPEPLNVHYLDVWGCPTKDALEYNKETCQGPSLNFGDNILILFAGPFTVANDFLSLGLSFYANKFGEEECTPLKFDISTNLFP